MKKMISLTASLMALTALVAPGAAQATTKASVWQDNHANLVNNAVIPYHGSTAFSGGTICPHVTGSIELFGGGSTTGQVLSYNVPSPGLCTVTGTLKALGCTELLSATAIPIGGGPNLAWPIHNQFTDITITGVEIIHHYKPSPFCPGTVIISGEITAVPDNTETIRDVSLHGKLKSNLGSEVEVSGTLTPTNASQVATYGLH